MLVTTPYPRLTGARLPWLSLGLALLWVLAFAASAIHPQLGAGLPLSPGDVAAGALAGHWLLHESWAHLAVGVVVMLLAGPVLEDAWGRLFYAGFLAAMLLATSAAYLCAQPDPERALVGGSGLAAALLGACIARQLRDGIHYTAVGWWRGPVHARFWIPAYALLGVWFAGEVLMQVVDDGLGSTRGVTYAGQAAGVLLGAAIARALLRFDLESRWLGRTPLSDTHPALEAAERALEESDGAAALRILRPAVELVRDDPALVAGLCRAACAAGEPEVARRPLVETIRTLLGTGRGPDAAALWADWAQALSRPRLDARLSLQLAEALAGSSENVEAARLLRALLEDPARLSTGAALRIVELARPIHAGVSVRAAHLALESGEFPVAKRERLEGIVRELEARRALDLDPQLDDDAPASESVERTIEIATEDDLRLPPAGSVDAGEPPPVAERASFELSTDGSLVGTGSDFELAAPEPLADPGALAGAGLEIAAAQTRFSEAKCVEVVPLAWEGARLQLQRGDAGSQWLELGEVQAVAAGAVRSLAARPVVLIDLLLNWSVVDATTLHVLRLRSDRFDPTSLLPAAGPGLDAFRALIGGLLEQSGGTPLPDAERAEGRPFAIFDRLDTYEREVLLLER